VFALELDRRLKDAGRSAVALACHPGYSATNLQTTGPAAWMGAVFRVANLLAAQSGRRGAEPTAFAAADPRAQRGAYYGPQGFQEMWGRVGDAKVASQALDDAAARRLWEVSEQLVGEAFDVSRET
jgi:hypothetical protein